MSQILSIVLYGLSLLFVSAAVPYGSTVPDVLSLHDTNLDFVNTMRQAKAAQMANSMNRSVDPCDDFYEFSCGNWAVTNKTSPQKRTTGLLEGLTTEFEKKIKVLLTKNDEGQVPPTDTLVKNLYKSCVALKKTDKVSHQKYNSIIEEFGQMPVLQGKNWSEETFDWVETASKIAFKYDLIVLGGVGVSTNQTDKQINAVYFIHQEFVLRTRSMYLSNDTAIYRDGYKKIMAMYLRGILGVEKNLSIETADELMDFEVQLAEGLISEKEEYDPSDLTNSVPVTEMQRLYAPDIDVERLVNGTLGQRIERLYNINPKYQENLAKVLRRTPKRVVANYIFYRLVVDFIIGPATTEAEKEIRCQQYLRKHFSRILDNLVFRSYNDSDTSQDIRNIWSELKTVLRKQLLTDSSLNWINNQTRKSAIEKLDAMTLRIQSHNLEELIEEFKELNMTENDFLLNQRRIKGFSALQSRHELNEPVKPLYASELSISPAHVTTENSISIPVSLLQPDFMWTPSYPNAIKFGTLAVIIGHELIHGFDNDGRDFDAKGNVNNWWDEQSTANFVERQNCFKQQYSKYFYNGKQLPESNQQSENIADNGGVKLGYAAYRQWLQAELEAGKNINQLETEQLPSLDYSNKQLFFISYAQLWCNDIKPDERNMVVAMDTHTPAKFRVIGALSNYEEFANEFKCQKGTRMNPIQKCQIY